jgi:Flp pilus assembly protein TadD
LREQGKLEEAVPLLQRAARANSSSSGMQRNLALALEDSGDARGAEALYEGATVRISKISTLLPEDAPADSGKATAS